jgi:hypothetical protein
MNPFLVVIEDVASFADAAPEGKASHARKAGATATADTIYSCFDRYWSSA